jgi:hypothetical protein
LTTSTNSFTPKKGARFRRQREAEHLKVLAAGRQHLELQALPIGNPNPVPKKILEQLEEEAQGRGKRRKVAKKPFEYSTLR